MATFLNFQLLDDLQNLPAPEILGELSDIDIQELGPAFELFFLNQDSVGEILSILRRSTTIENLQHATSGRNGRVDSNFSECEIVQIPGSIAGVESATWTSFLLRAQRAAEASGIVKNLAQALVGTLEEMAENVIWHSAATHTGLVGYKWESGRFEYCVGDAGIGVLESLRRNPIYVDLEEPLEALHLALKNGVSRFRSDNQRGTGFNGLLRNIVKNCCDLRFHTYDAVVVYEGVASCAKADAIKMKDFMAPMLRGFTISLSCKID